MAADTEQEKLFCVGCFCLVIPQTITYNTNK